MPRQTDDDPPTPPRIDHRTPMRAVWTFAGCLALAIGALGVVLPVLPTTPFVLLAAFAFGRGSPRLRRWLQSHRVFGPFISDWETHGAIAPRYKKLACAMMAAVFAISLVMGVSATILAVQAVCLGGAAAYVLTRPNGPRQP